MNIDNLAIRQGLEPSVHIAGDEDDGIGGIIDEDIDDGVMVIVYEATDNDDVGHIGE